MAAVVAVAAAVVHPDSDDAGFPVTKTDRIQRNLVKGEHT